MKSDRMPANQAAMRSLACENENFSCPEITVVPAFQDKIEKERS